MAATFVEEAAGIQEYRLSNGLKVLLVENHSAPVITVLVVYRVGSRNEAVGYTGSTHFLEHMLFKGTPNFNKAKGTLIAQVLTREGANYNATTWLDRTTYYETLASDKLELALQIESERMQHAFVRDKDRQAEMTVVRNELERDESEPDSIMWKNLFAQAYLAHPYHHPTIGWNSDVEGVPTSRLRHFYKEFYHPNNATLVVVGDQKAAQSLKLIEKYFGSIPPSKRPIPEMYTQEFPQQGERRFTIKQAGQLGLVQMAWHVPALGHPDSYALDVLQDILSDGVSSRLYQAVVEKQLGLYAGGYNLQLRDPGLFIISSKLSSQSDHASVEKAIEEVLAELQRKAPTKKELERVKNQTKAAFSFNRHGNHHLASMLGEFEAMASWKYMTGYLEHLEAVTPKDVQRVAQTYFKTDNRTVGHFIPVAADTVIVEGPGSITKPALAVKTQSTTPKPSGKKVDKGDIQRIAIGKQAALLVQENHLDNTVALQGKIMAGSIYTDNQYGLAEMTAAMLKKGTQRLDKLKLSDELAFMGSSIDFRTGTDSLTFSGRCLSEHLDKTLDLLEEILCEPSFPMAELDKLKKQRIDRLKQRLDNTDAMAYDLLMRNLYPEHHLHWQPTVKELIEATEALTLKDIQAFYKKHYGSQHLMMAVAGNVNTAKLAKRLESLSTWNTQNPLPPTIADVPVRKPGELLVYPMPDKANVSIMMGHPTTLKRNSEDFFAATLANHALGQSSLSSRLGLHVRDNLGLTYGIHSYFSDVGRGSGSWLLSVTTHPQNVDRTIAESKRVVEQYRKDGITAQELADGKSSMIGSFLVNLSTNPEIAYRLIQIEQYGLGLDYFQHRGEMIQKVTRKQVNTAIKAHIDPDQLTIALAGLYNKA